MYFTLSLGNQIDESPITRNTVTPTFASRFFGDKIHWPQWECIQNIEFALI